MSPEGAFAYIHDGYTRAGYLAEEPRLYPAVRFTYRPMLSQNRAVLYAEIDRQQDPRKQESLAAQAIKSQLCGWDVVDHRGRAVPLEVSSILRLQPRLMNRIFRMVMGEDGGDEDPDLTTAERDREAERALSEALAGTTPEQRERATEKNCAAG